MVKQGYDVGEMVESLGRSAKSVQGMRVKLGLASTYWENRPRVTPAERSKMLILEEQGFSRRQIAVKLKRPAGTVIRHLWEFKRELALKRKPLGSTDGSSAPV
jgi:hypothetical protein